ncbi:MAG: hypothetical protein H6Q67_973 [Firmicutes bacterium]|nr:hypothetical protein [Bacillota bacterium]
MRLVVVGPCASGKTTLVGKLRDKGINAFNVAQEHSGIKKLWRKKCPDHLVMLDASIAAIRRRRKVPWGEERLVVQHERLTDAKANANLYLFTDELSADEVLETVMTYLKKSDGDTRGRNHSQ